jgi:hypothetical protein
MPDFLISINVSVLNYLNSFANNEIIKQIIYIFADAPIFFLPVFLITYWIYYTYKKEISESDKFEKKSNLLFITY